MVFEPLGCILNKIQQCSAQEKNRTDMRWRGAGQWAANNATIFKLNLLWPRAACTTRYRFRPSVRRARTCLTQMPLATCSATLRAYRAKKYTHTDTCADLVATRIITLAAVQRLVFSLFQAYGTALGERKEDRARSTSGQGTALYMGKKNKNPGENKRRGE